MRLLPAIVLATVALCQVSAQVSAQVSTVITEQGGLRLYWSQLRFSYSSGHKAESYSEAQQQAWEAGLAGFATAIKHLYQQQQIAASHVPMVVADASRHLFLQRTVFFADFKAQHQVSGSMTRLFPATILPSRAGLPSRADKQFKSEHTANNTGLVIKVSAGFKPQVFYEIKDSAGKLRFDASYVRQEAFKSKLMGRYFTSNDKRRIRAHVGSKPYTLPAQPLPSGQLQVNKSAWDKFIVNNEKILHDSRIAIVLVE